MKARPSLYPVILVALFFGLIANVFAQLGGLALPIPGGFVWSPLTPQDFYGKVVDQYGQPISGVEVEGSLVTFERIGGGGDGTTGGGSRNIVKYHTKSDGNGLFQFNLHGNDLWANVKKEGYQIGRLDSDYITTQHPPFLTPYTPPNKENKTTPSERGVFIMYKLKGAEPMLRSKMRTEISGDGVPLYFNSMTGKKVATIGDLIIKYDRNPINVAQGKPFTWSLTLEAQDGGLIETDAPYPYEAPKEGYKKSITISFHPEPGQTQYWPSTIIKTYYYKINGGKFYGRITINFSPHYRETSAYLEMSVYLNPSDSRNLEFDPAKEIKPK
jgi:hypothetical protein